MTKQASPETIVREPIFSRQEQGVVYLFSRYWDKIDLFSSKRICNIHTHFPDFSVEDKNTGAVEAVEFEYGLSDFDSHLYGDLKKLREDDIKLLYIVYWDEDADRKEMLRRIRKHFAGRVTFFCLNQYFSPCVEPDSDSLRASWVFSMRKRIREAYSFGQIEKDTRALMNQGVFEQLAPRSRLYRTIGFNKQNADFIECDHWKAIHLFTTTTGFDKNNMPSRLFVKPSRYQSFSGYFDIKYTFVINKGSEPVKKYFRDYYFYPYYPDRRYHTNFVYSRFREFTREQGVELFRYLEPKYSLGVRGSMVIDDPDHLKGIDRIVEAGGR